jgi:hypothetical protein
MPKKIRYVKDESRGMEFYNFLFSHELYRPVRNPGVAESIVKEANRTARER